MEHPDKKMEAGRKESEGNSAIGDGHGATSGDEFATRPGPANTPAI
jgi:hypothetical protein